MTGGHLTIKNNSEWPVTEVIVMSPDWLPRSHIPYLGPGREHVEQLPLEQIRPVGPSDEPVSLQLQDARSRLWRWTPTAGQLSSIPPPIPVHAHVAQWLARRIPWLFRPFFRILPKRAQVWLWGYDPVG
jgi:hypothetical protein